MNLPHIQSELFRELVGMEVLFKPEYKVAIWRTVWDCIQFDIWKLDATGGVDRHVFHAYITKEVTPTTPSQITAEITRIWQAIPAECKKENAL